ncbi:hypothetical protein A2392_02975 [Candidatus Kaiserbacteria bacterium RIFOXYB1_FULL_46_14]|uniref:POTRA domain-containing protein n=1 Tax=Candidatus Kaiserbacteria bacterium RIFOXYB1_FULL_46_14 TaxID=1798531 RepID=A0A1F6FIQ6_9BACT|nr:MAG: hypothetical protein A2392_02975 [Candidatus Kaiserbacteria bacterium RIFOXYB1_FULL_46_14]
MFGRSRLMKGKARTTTKLRRVLTRVLIVLIIFTPLAILSYGAWYVTHLSALTLREIKVEGGKTISRSEIEKVVNEELTGTYYHLVPKRFAWFYPEERIIEQIKAVPRVKDVTVERTSGDELVINFSEYLPFALWCAHPTVSEPDRCLFIDDEGTAFASAPPLSGSALLRFVDEKNEPALHQQIFSHDWLQLGGEFASEIKEHFGFTILYLERINESEIFYHLGSGGLVKISSDKNATTTLNDLQTIFSNPQFSHLRSGDFAHIDLRYGNKVFVKEKEVEQNASSSTEGEIVDQ